MEKNDSINFLLLLLCILLLGFVYLNSRIIDESHQADQKVLIKNTRSIDVDEEMAH
jgi:hypothetical protein